MEGVEEADEMDLTDVEREADVNREVDAESKADVEEVDEPEGTIINIYNYF